MQDEERLADDGVGGHFAPATRVEAVGGVIAEREVMLRRDGVFLVQRDGVAVAAGVRQIPVITLVHRTAAVERHRFGRGHDLSVDEEFALSVDAQFLTGNAGETLHVIVLGRLAVLVVQARDRVRPEDEGVTAGRLDEMVGHPVDEEHVTGEDVEIEQRRAGRGRLAGQQHRAEGTVLDATLADGLGEDHAPAVLILAGQLQLGLFREIRPQDDRLEAEVGGHLDGLQGLADEHLVLVGGALPDARTEKTVIRLADAGAQAVLGPAVGASLHHDRDGHRTRSLGGDDVSPGPLDLVDDLPDDARGRRVGRAYLGGHAVVRGPHRIRRDLERLQEEAADGAGHDGGHHHHLGVVRAGSHRVDLAAVTGQDLMQAVEQRLDLGDLAGAVLDGRADLVGQLELVVEVGARQDIPAVEVHLLRPFEQGLADLAELAAVVERHGGRPQTSGRRPEGKPELGPQPSFLRILMKASCGMSTLPICFMRFLPSFCLSRSLRLREMSPP